jgi:hypothetical protein
VIGPGIASRSVPEVRADLAQYLEQQAWPESRQRRMVDGLRTLQDLASNSHRPVTYKKFADRVQPGLASLATGKILEDIGVFCNTAGWPNVTCFVVSASTGECSVGFTRGSDQDPAKARDEAWLAYAAYKTGIRVDDE